MIAILAAIVTAQASLGLTSRGLTSQGLMSYEQTVRCAGLTQAASELEGGESARGRRLFDAALFWSLTAMQAADIAGRDLLGAEREQTQARITAVRELSNAAQAAAAREALRHCLNRTPSLD